MQYIILLRGINIGGRTIKMDELKACFQKAGYQNILTVLQTGNVILESADVPEKLQTDIEKLLEKTFHYPARVIVLLSQQLQHIITDYPFKNLSPDFHRYVLFTEQENVATLVKTHSAKLDETIEAIQAGNEVLYWRVLKGHTLDSFFAKNMAKTAKSYFLTNRNLNTLEKVLKKCN